VRNEPYLMRDPTGEAAPVQRERRKPPTDLSAATIGLLSISKERSDEFLDSMEQLLKDRGLTVLRFKKPTHTKPAPEAVLANIVERCDVVVEGLAD
jgi:hypothetical protein